MTITVSHTFQSAKSQGADATKVRKDDWNGNHNVVADGPGIAGRSAAGSGALTRFTLDPLLKFDGSTFRALDDLVDKGTVSSGTVTFDLSAGRYQRLQVGGALTVAFSNPPTSGRYAAVMIELVNGGSATITWPNPAMKWAAGAAPTLTAAGTDILMFVTRDAGTTWRGIVSALDSK